MSAAAHVHFEVLAPGGSAGFVNLRPGGRRSPTPEQSFVVKRAADGVWRLRVDLRPGVSGPGVTGASPRLHSRSGVDRDAWDPPRRDTTRGNRAD